MNLSSLYAQFQYFQHYKLRYCFFILISIAVIIADQLSKYGIEFYLQPGHSIEITSFFSITLVYNTGAAFSILSNAGGWQRLFLIAVSSIATIVLLLMLATTIQDKLKSASIACILGGAVGNLIDRLAQGKVIDFLLFGYNNWYFPAFNIADIAISLGVGLVLLDMLLNKNNTDRL